ncbi:dTMP kinase [Sphingomonas lutea]
METREPGGSEGAERIRDLLLQGAEDRWNARAEALLFAAARADHVVKTIEPALAAGAWVLCDRFVDSSLAYQGGAGGLGVAEVRAINAFAIGNGFPDRTLILLLPDGNERAAARDRDRPDRIGGRPADYHQAVDRAFREIAAAEPERVTLVDATGTLEAVTARLVAALADLLP